jgi:fluoride exporter
MQQLLLVGAGGCLGALARYGMHWLVHRWYPGGFPLGTLLINVSGCFAAGCLMWAIEDARTLAPQTRLFWMIGVLGAFTTFSTFGYETVASLLHGYPLRALVSVAGNLLLGCAAVAAGRGLLLALTR